MDLNLFIAETGLLITVRVNTIALFFQKINNMRFFNSSRFNNIVFFIIAMAAFIAIYYLIFH